MEYMPGSLSASPQLYFHIGLLPFIKGTRKNPMNVITIFAGNG